MSINVYFGKVVKQLRDSQRISQEALATRAGLNRTYLGEVERGIAIPSLVTIAKIATALNLATSELIARSEQLLGSELPGIKLVDIKIVKDSS
jgi:XRE family transcriptional regulator, regulator of sulfur utilization